MCSLLLSHQNGVHGQSHWPSCPGAAINDCSSIIKPMLQKIGPKSKYIEKEMLYNELKKLLFVAWLNIIPFFLQLCIEFETENEVFCSLFSLFHPLKFRFALISIDLKSTETKKIQKNQHYNMVMKPRKNKLTVYVFFLIFTLCIFVLKLDWS